MHIIIGFLGSLITVLWLLHRLAEMGIDLGGLNPWTWRRRRAWRKKYQANPIFSIDKPMDATALLMTAVAKADGDMSAEDKEAILAIFEREFHLSSEDASSLLGSSVYLLGRGDEVRDNLKGVLAGSMDKFTPEQSESAIELLTRVASMGKGPTAAQAALVEGATGLLRPAGELGGKWA